MVSQKNTHRMLLEPWCTGSIISGWAWKVFFGRFLLILSRIKRPQVMSMVKFCPTALNFGYAFVLLVHFFRDTLYIFDLKRSHLLAS